MTTYQAPTFGSEQPRGVSVGIVIVIAIAALVLGCFGGFLLGTARTMVTAAQSLWDVDAHVDVACDAPHQVQVGEEFDVVVTVTDTLQQARTLRDIDLEGDLLANVEMVSVTPTPTSTDAYPGYAEHVFDTPLAAGGQFSVTFRLKATAAGHFHALLTVYMDEYDWTEIPVSIDVGDQPEGGPQGQ